MKKRNIVLLSVIFAALFLLASAVGVWGLYAFGEAITLNEAPHRYLTVTTFNIRNLCKEEKIEQNWINRKLYLREELNLLKSDIFGFQEVQPLQYGFLENVLKDYDSAVTYRDKKLFNDEGCSIFWRKDKFSLLSSGTFWLSETPEVKSKSWDSAYSRICTYVLLKDLINGRQIMIFNTHFDNHSEQTRNNSAKLIISKINELTQGLQIPFALIGDFNALINSTAIKTLKAEFELAQETSPNAKKEYVSYNGWGHYNRQYDFIFSNKLKVTDFEISSTLYGGNYASDHFAVTATFS